MKTNPTLNNNNMTQNINPSNINKIYGVNTENILNNPNINITDHHNAYITNNDTGKNIIYDVPKNVKYNSKTNVEKIETYFTNPKSGNKIKIDAKNTIEPNKYKNKTYTGETYLSEKIYSNENYAKVEKVSGFNNFSNKEVETLSPILENLNINATAIIDPQISNQVNIEKKKLTASSLSVSILSDIPYQSYPEAKHSNESSENFAGFGVNSYNGKVKKNNEDRIKVVAHQIMSSRKDPIKNSL